MRRSKERLPRRTHARGVYDERRAKMWDGCEYDGRAHVLAEAIPSLARHTALSRGKDELRIHETWNPSRRRDPTPSRSKGKGPELTAHTLNSQAM